MVEKVEVEAEDKDIITIMNKMEDLVINLRIIQMILPYLNLIGHRIQKKKNKK